MNPKNNLKTSKLNVNSDSIKVKSKSKHLTSRGSPIKTEKKQNLYEEIKEMINEN